MILFQTYFPSLVWRLNVSCQRSQSSGDKGIWLPVANIRPFGRLPIGTINCTAIRRCNVILFAPSSPPSSPVGAIHGAFSSHSFGGDSGSNPHLFNFCSVIQKQYATRLLYPLEIRGFEPLASSLQSWRSSQLSYIPE